MSRKLLIAIAATVVIAAAAVWYFFLRAPAVPPVYRVAIAATYPHDPEAFTQGLFFHQGRLYEGTGQVGASNVRKTDPTTGEVLQQQDLPPPHFGEGIVAWKDRLYQVTWQSQEGFTYNLADLALRDSFTYAGEGWGLTHDGKRLILSDGTATLRFLDPETLKPAGSLAVTAGGCPVANLNELEWVDGEIYANIWQTDLIARIDPATGKVKSFLDVSALGPETGDPDAVANGIAWDASTRRLFVTGKRWPQLYEVRQGAQEPESAEAAKLVACAK